ncbi:hypothetical protein BBP40_002477 [Aspergillus hancockii]|nr:hypothetical protein BBP40_002477 [Aspergillus hancockii]
MLQPFPKFYIIRPQGSLVPLIPVDELPAWIQVGNWDWNDVTMFTGMAPASFSAIPRIGEYDVVCLHCNASLDNLHRSVSEQSAMSSNSSSLPATKTNKNYSGAFLSRSSREPLSPLSSSNILSLKQPLFYTAEYPAFLKLPPYYANLQSPFVGMCLVPECCRRLWKGTPPRIEENFAKGQGDNQDPSIPETPRNPDDDQGQAEVANNDTQGSGQSEGVALTKIPRIKGTQVLEGREPGARFAPVCPITSQPPPPVSSKARLSEPFKADHEIPPPTSSSGASLDSWLDRKPPANLEAISQHTGGTLRRRTLSPTTSRSALLVDLLEG